MKKRFVILLDGGTKEQSASFVTDLKAKGIYWWHWIGNAWLLSNEAGGLSAVELRDLANKHFPGIHKVVLELRADGSDTWAGFGPSRPDRDMFKWILENWKK